MTTSWRRFHPAAVAFNTLQALGGLVVPVAVAAVGGGGGIGRIVGWGMAGVVLAGVAGVVRWRTNEWRVADGAIVHRAGWLNLKERSVPLARVQSLDAIRGPVHRAFDVAAVRVQTAGGDKAAEIVLPALTREELAGLRRAAGVELDPSVATAPRRRLGPGGVLVAGLTAGSAGVILAVGAVAAQVAQEVFDDEGRGVLRHVADVAPGSVGGWVLVVGVLLAAAWLLGVLGTVVAFWGFEVVRDDDRLRIARGLLSRRETSIAVGRVRAVRVVEGVLRQPLGLAALRIDVLGAGGEPPANQTLFPLLRRSAVAGLLADLLPEHPAPIALHRAPGRAARSYALLPGGALLVLGAAAWAFVPGVGWWALAFAPLGAAWGLLGWRDAGIGLRSDAVTLRSRRFARTTTVFDPGRAQSTTVSQQPLQRRSGLATVRLSLGRRAAAGVRHLDAGDCWRLWRMGC